jgi:hypothetical protein
MDSGEFFDQRGRKKHKGREKLLNVELHNIY